MDGSLTCLYPPHGREVPLEGLYLGHRLRERARTRAFVYTNFVASLDGRISEADPQTGLRRVPKAVANARDMRLYMELLAQADVVLTTANHLRTMAKGETDTGLGLDPRKHPDLIAWRENQGLPQTPVCAAFSSGLDLPLDLLRQHFAGRLLVLTGEAAPAARVRTLESAGIKVVKAGPGARANGHLALKAMADQGLTSIYSVAGPQVLRTLLHAGVLDRLYLTLAQVIVAGEHFDTLGHGAPLVQPAGFRLHQLYHDPWAPGHAEQLFASFDRVP